jgi:hypothetical protein
MRLTPEQLDFIAKNRHEPPKKLARELGVSVRHVDRALRDLGDKAARRRTRLRNATASALALVAVSVTGYLTKSWFDSRQRGTAKEEAKQRALIARATEHTIYDELDRREKGHDDDVAKQLSNEDEAVRLAAIRYLLTSGSGARLATALEHVKDPAQRVRLATIQMAADSPASAAVDETLLGVASDKAAGLPERTMALSGLRKRPVARVRPLGPRLLDLLGEPLEPLRRGAHDVLASAFPEARLSYLPDPARLRAVWQDVVEVRH